MTSLDQLKASARERFAELLEGRTLHWFESANGKTILLARLDTLTTEAYGAGKEEVWQELRDMRRAVREDPEGTLEMFKNFQKGIFTAPSTTEGKSL